MVNSEKLIAAALVGFCGVAAVGSWFTRHEAAQSAKQEASSSFGKSLFTKKKGDIAVIEIDGVITEGGDSGPFGGSGSGAKGILKAIDRIRKDKCAVVLLKINSPGGSAAASATIFEELLKLKKQNKTKIVAAFGDMAASGGYYIACAADKIISHPATLTGSIGVIMHLANYQGLMGKIGVQGVVIKSGKHKDIGSPDRPMTPEERQILQSIIDDTYGDFLQAVSVGRGMPVAKVRPLADGRIFTGRQAKKVGLVDGLGTYKTAEEEARKLAGLSDDATVKNYSEEDWQNYFQGLVGETWLDPLSQVVGRRQALLQSGALDRIPLMLYE